MSKFKLSLWEKKMYKDELLWKKDICQETERKYPSHIKTLTLAKTNRLHLRLITSDCVSCFSSCFKTWTQSEWTNHQLEEAGADLRSVIKD